MTSCRGRGCVRTAVYMQGAMISIALYTTRARHGDGNPCACTAGGSSYVAHCYYDERVRRVSNSYRNSDSVNKNRDPF